MYKFLQEIPTAKKQHKVIQKSPNFSPKNWEVVPKINEILPIRSAEVRSENLRGSL